LTDDGPVYHALIVHLSPAKLITRFDDRYAVAKFSVRRLEKKFQQEVPLFLKVPEIPYNTVQERWKEATMPKTSPIRSTVSTEHRLVSK